MSWTDCPNCTHNTAWEDEDTHIRCIPCGYNLVPRERWATPEQSARNAQMLSGER